MELCNHWNPPILLFVTTCAMNPSDESIHVRHRKKRVMKFIATNQKKKEHEMRNSNYDWGDYACTHNLCGITKEKRRKSSRVAASLINKNG